MARRMLKGSAKLMQKLNTSLILEIIQESGPISRAELAKQTRLSNPAVSTLIANLMEEGLVEEVGIADSTGGRPARLLQFNPKSGFLVGVDIGANNMSGAVVDMGGNIVLRKSCRSTRGKESVDILIDLIAELWAEAGQPAEKFKGIGIGIPGITGNNGQRVSFAPALGWDDFDLGATVGARFSVPVFADNDVNCFARGELWQGALKNATNGAALTVGTGIGAGLVIDGRVYRGSQSAAGEVGYWLLGALGPIEKRTGFGHLESIAAGPGIARQAVEKLERNPKSGTVLREMVQGNLDQITAKEVFAAALQGDKLSQGVVKKATEYLGVLVGNMASLLNMEKVVIGGGLSRSGEQLVAPIRRIVEELCPYPPEIEVSTLQEDATILGAVSGVLELRESSIQFSHLTWEGF